MLVSLLKDVSFVPDGTVLVKSNRILEVMEIIMEKTEPTKYCDKIKIVRVLKEAVKNGEDIKSQVHHANSIQDMLGKDRIFD